MFVVIDVRSQPKRLRQRQYVTLPFYSQVELWQLSVKKELHVVQRYEKAFFPKNKYP